MRAAEVALLSAVTAFQGEDNALRYKTLEKIKVEVSALLDAGVRQVKFVDRTFNGKKEWALAVAKMLQSIGHSGCNFHFEVSLDALDETMIRFFQQAPKGLFQLEIGIQSTNKEALKNVRRLNNFSKIKEHMALLLSAGNIHLHTDLIAGLPFEDLASFKESFNSVYGLKGHMLQVGFLKVIPNTHLKQHADSLGLLYASYPPYEILQTHWLSYEDLFQIKYVEEGVDHFYNQVYFRQIFNYLEAYMVSPFDFFLALGKGYFHLGKQLGILEKYDYLKIFILDYFPQLSQEEIEAIMTFEWYLNEPYKKGNSWVHQYLRPLKDHLDVILEEKSETINRKRLGDYKLLEFPFVFETHGIDFKFTSSEKQNYFISYQNRSGLYDYPEVQKINI